MFHDIYSQSMYIFIFSYLQRLEEQITKASPTLGRDAVYQKSVSTYISIFLLLCIKKCFPNLEIIIIALSVGYKDYKILDVSILFKVMHGINTYIFFY